MSMSVQPHECKKPISPRVPAPQLRSQGLSSLAPWGGKMRDHGNEVARAFVARGDRTAENTVPVCFDAHA